MQITANALINGTHSYANRLHHFVKNGNI